MTGMYSNSLNPPELTLGIAADQFGAYPASDAYRSVGFAMLYSAANGSWTPWAMRQVIRFGV